MNEYGHIQRGFMMIGGREIFFRSGWEKIYARYLQLLLDRGMIQDWEYEPKTFWFEEIRSGNTSYTPDFLVLEKDGSKAWHEVKGHMDNNSRVKLKRMAKYYPEEKIIVVGADWFKKNGAMVEALTKNAATP